MRFLFHLFLVLLVIFRVAFFRPNFVDGSKIRITSKITQEPVRYSFQQKINLYGLAVFLPLFPEINYGDELVVEGKVDLSDSKFGNGRLLNAVIVEHKQSGSAISKVRQKVIDFYLTKFPEPHASLIAGIVLGSKSQIPGDFWLDLKKTGTTHIIVASGMNVVFVASFLIGFFSIFLSRKKALPFAVAGVWLYSLLSGFDAPIIRAAIMGTLVFSAQELGRLSNSWRILILTAVSMLIIKPEWLSDLGFILSFVATASLMLFKGKIEKFLKDTPRVIKEGLSTSLAAQIGVAPILFVTFGQFNILSPLVNALILWTVPYIMIIAAFAGILGLVSPFLGGAFLYLSYPLTWWFVTIVKIFA